ncbi:MAG: hypothetical protein AAB576_06745 [Elusimicrobiota bacterium]
MDRKLMDKYLRETRLVRAPKRMLSTFGATRIQYHLVSPVDELPDRARLREGFVVSEKPLVLTPQALRERFEGFGPDSREFFGWLEGRYGRLLRALEYRFKNQDFNARVVGQDPLSTAERIRDDMDSRDVREAAVISCPDGAWSLALMKFTLDEAERAFPVNVKDLERRGMFPG